MDDLIQSIREAEEKALKIRAEAYEKAAAISAGAAERAANIERANAEECRINRENVISEAEKEAEEAYNGATAAAGREAKAYADSVLENTDIVVGKIVGRICGGNS